MFYSIIKFGKLLEGEEIKVKFQPDWRKQEYVKITRKLRNYVSELKKENKISEEDYKRLRKEIKTRDFKSKSQLKEHLEIK